MILFSRFKIQDSGSIASWPGLALILLPPPICPRIPSAAADTALIILAVFGCLTRRDRLSTIDRLYTQNLMDLSIFPQLLNAGIVAFAPCASTYWGLRFTGSVQGLLW